MSGCHGSSRYSTHSAVSNKSLNNVNTHPVLVHLERTYIDQLSLLDIVYLDLGIVSSNAEPCPASLGIL